MQPTISVIIPVYNTEKYIADAVNSVLAQNYPDLEIIVVNDGSTDGTLDVLKSFDDKITIINQENQGQSVARNVGIQQSHGSIIGFLDADDVWTSDHIEVLLPYMIGEDSYDIARGYTQWVKFLDEPNEERQEPVWQPVSLGAGLHQRSVFDRVGWLDPDMRQGQDFDWAVRAQECGCREKKVTALVQLYRRHEGNLTNDQERLKRGCSETLLKKLARAKARQAEQISKKKLVAP